MSKEAPNQSLLTVAADVAGPADGDGESAETGGSAEGLGDPFGGGVAGREQARRGRLVLAHLRGLQQLGALQHRRRRHQHHGLRLAPALLRQQDTSTTTSDEREETDEQIVPQQATKQDQETSLEKDEQTTKESNRRKIVYPEQHSLRASSVDPTFALFNLEYGKIQFTTAPL